MSGWCYCWWRCGDHDGGLIGWCQYTVVVCSDNFTFFIYFGAIPFCHYSPFLIIYYIHACQRPTTPSFIIIPQTAQLGQELGARLECRLELITNWAQMPSLPLFIPEAFLMWGYGMWALVAILLAVDAIILPLCLFIPTKFLILCLVLVVALLLPATGQANGQVTI